MGFNSEFKGLILWRSQLWFREHNNISANSTLRTVVRNVSVSTNSTLCTVVRNVTVSAAPTVQCVQLLEMGRLFVCIAVTEG